jgi:hypothetical protein
LLPFWFVGCCLSRDEAWFLVAFQSFVLYNANKRHMKVGLEENWCEQLILVSTWFEANMIFMRNTLPFETSDIILPW